MEQESKMPKFAWGKKFEHDSGHNNREWGTPDVEDEISNIRFIQAYTIKGDLANISTSGFVRSHLR